jgi:protein-tyrosine kinase
MSRIHDALKKAEMDRAAAHEAEVAALPLDPQRLDRTQEGIAAPISPASLTAILTQANVIPSSPDGPLRYDDLLARCAHPQWHSELSSNVFNPLLGEHGAEQFRTLRSRLYQVRGNQPLQTLLVTSAVSGEGKTFVTSNLGQAMVRHSDRHALLIDADLRSSHLHVPLGAPVAPGLTDYLRGAADEIAVMQYGQESGLFFIPGGNEVTNPSELLSNGRLKTLLDRVAPVFDWIIIDSPPCLPVADASVLADFCDGLILVVRAGSTPAEVAQKARQELAGKNVVGVVLNAVQEEALAYGSYYRSGYYGNERAKEPDNKSKPVPLSEAP